MLLLLTGRQTSFGIWSGSRNPYISGSCVFCFNEWASHYQGMTLCKLVFSAPEVFHGTYPQASTSWCNLSLSIVLNLQLVSSGLLRILACLVCYYCFESAEIDPLRGLFYWIFSYNIFLFGPFIQPLCSKVVWPAYCLLFSV